MRKCKNGGTCIKIKKEDNTYVPGCKCPKEYHGDYCEKRKFNILLLHLSRTIREDVKKFVI